MATWLHFRESFCSINSIFILLPQFFCISGPLFSYCLSLAFRVEKAMAPHSSTLAWKIPWTEEPGRLQFTGSLGVGHDFTFTFHFHALEKEMATHSSVLVWRIPGTGEPGGLLSMGSHRVGHKWGDLAAVAAAARSLIPWLEQTPCLWEVSSLDSLVLCSSRLDKIMHVCISQGSPEKQDQWDV